MKGASEKEWRLFRDLVGYENLLPVAPDGEPSPKSKLSASNIGKVPSRYRDDGVAGFKDWSSYKATLPEVGRWALDNRYSVSVILGRPQGKGHLYALDVDINDDAMQDRIYELLLTYLPAGFPWRMRSNSARRLYPVIIQGAPLRKRVLSLGQKDGKPEAIEMLGLGQQFVAAGTHPSGARYAWRDIPFIDEDPDYLTLPTLTEQQFTSLWALFEETLPVVSSTEARAGKHRRTDGKFRTDDVADFLDAEGWVFTSGPNGERYLRSPREHLYSTKQTDGDTSLCYFPAGCGGFERGHFVSLHASDADMSDSDWLDEFGLRVAEFEDIEEEKDQIPTFRDRKKDGKIPTTLSNLMLACASPVVMGLTFRYDTFTQTIIATSPKGNVVELDDALVTLLTTRLQDRWRFEDCSSKKVLECIVAVSRKNKFDSLQEWLKELKWDGVPRCATFFCDVWSMPLDVYHEAVGRYFWTALAGRALVPGIQADMTPVLISREQGKAKSKALRALVPLPAWFTSMDFGDSRTERIRKMRGKCLIELEEMQGMGRREIGEIRSFMTEMTDTTRNPYERITVDLPRRCVFVATTNDETPFNDGAGNRRWLPMEIDDDFDPAQVVKFIETHRDQLWAEAVVLFRKNGVMWEGAQTLARDQLVHYESVSDTVEAKLMQFLNSETLDGDNMRWRDREYLSNADILTEAFPNAGARELAIKREFGVTLRRLGYVYMRMRQGGSRKRFWFKK